MMTIDAIVVGAGIWGCTVARRLADTGRRVLLVDRRSVIGGNVSCKIDGETGIEIHRFGSHIFHTHIPDVWDFVNRFAKFNGYRHKVLARYKGRTYFLPIGLALINKFFGTELAPNEAEDFMREESRSAAIFEAFFRGYTSKQWGRPPEEIDPSIIKRVPVRYNYDVNYFTDYNQGIPLDGYNAFFCSLVDHPYIAVRCDVTVTLGRGRFMAGGDELPNVPVYYSGPLDELFGYRFGALPWRTLRFATEKLAVRDFQGTSVVNYPEFDIPYTRIHEFKHYHPECSEIMEMQKTIVMREYPAEWHHGDEPYYPIDNADSRGLFAKYHSLAKMVPNLVVGGRLGGYKYYDMDKSVEAALSVGI